MRELRTEEEIISSWGGDFERPIVSICCITYNQESYVEDALEGFLIQETDFAFEILVHDDASTDRTAEIVREYAAQYPRLIRPIFQAENRYSKGFSMNESFNYPRVKGSYIALCEGDDYWMDKTKLQKQVSFLEANSEYVITYSDCVAFDENGVITTDFGGAKRDLEAIELKKATPIFTLTACFRNVIKEIPQDVMGARFGDLVMWSLLGQYGKGKYLPNISPSRYRVHDGGIFSKKSIIQKYEMDIITKAALLSYWERVGDRKLCDFYKKEIIRSSMISAGLLNVPKEYFSLIVQGIVFVMKKVFKFR